MIALFGFSTKKDKFEVNVALYRSLVDNDVYVFKVCMRVGVILHGVISTADCFFRILQVVMEHTPMRQL